MPFNTLPAEGKEQYGTVRYRVPRVIGVADRDGDEEGRRRKKEGRKQGGRVSTANQTSFVGIYLLLHFCTFLKVRSAMRGGERRGEASIGN